MDGLSQSMIFAASGRQMADTMGDTPEFRRRDALLLTKEPREVGLRIKAQRFCEILERGWSACQLPGRFLHA